MYLCIVSHFAMFVRFCQKSFDLSGLFSHMKHSQPLNMLFGFGFGSGFSTGLQRTHDMENRFNTNFYNMPIQPTAMPIRPMEMPVAGEHIYAFCLLSPHVLKIQSCITCEGLLTLIGQHDKVAEGGSHVERVPFFVKSL